MITPILVAIALTTVAPAAFAQTAPTTVAQDEHHLTIDSPIKDLLADPEAAAVLEKHLPELNDHPMLAQFQDSSLPAVAPMSQGRITPEIIAEITEELAALEH